MEIGVRRGIGRGDQIAEGVVLVCVGDGAGGVGEQPHRAPAIVLVEAGSRSAIHRLKLADALQTVSVIPHNLPVDDLFNHLRVAGGVEVVDQVLPPELPNILHLAKRNALDAHSI